jgi:hypothetical protein
MSDLLSILAVLISIPIGIAANLLTPKFLAWYQDRNAKAKAKKEATAARKELIYQYMAENQLVFMEHLNHSRHVIERGSILIVLCGTLGSITILSAESEGSDVFIRALAGLFMMMMSLLSFKVSRLDEKLRTERREVHMRAGWLWDNGKIWSSASNRWEDLQGGVPTDVK